MKILRISSEKKLTLIVKDFSPLVPPFCLIGAYILSRAHYTHVRARNK